MILKKTALSDEVFQVLKTRIIDQYYQPGEKLKQESVSSDLGVSASPVREAFNQLEKEGWVENIPHCGRIVKKFDEHEIEETYVVRSALEELAVELAMPNIKLRNIRNMEKAAGKMHEALLSRDFKGDLNAEIEFHSEIVNAASNKTLQNIFILLLEKGRAVITKDYPSDDKQLKKIANRVHDEHLQIIKAVEQKNIIKAKQLIHDHIAKRKHLNYL